MIIEEKMITATNPAVLKWARERSGFSLDELASKMNRDAGELRKWESGESSPPYGALEDLAYKYLKVPLAIFFFPSPPKVDDPVGKFRRLPEYELERFSPDTIQKIRLAQAYQSSLEELFEDNPPERMIHVDLGPENYSSNVFAEKVRNYLGITLSQQFSFRGTDQAFKAWRHALENSGVFTFKDSFSDRFLSGFCLVHEEYPVVMINNSNSFTRQIFTLIHELGHILYGVNGVTDINEDYFKFLTSKEKRIEIHCNQFAAEVLVPAKRFEREIPVFEEKGPESISELAAKYSVSREVILRRFLDFGLIDDNYYSALAEKWNEEYLRSKEGPSGGNWYRTKLAYLGEGFSQTVLDNYRKGKFDTTAVASHLNIKAKNVKKFESYLWR